MRIRKMNAATGTHLLAKYGLKGVAYVSDDGKLSRYICACGNVSNNSCCEACGNEEYKTVNGRGCLGSYLLTTADGIYTHKDDPTIDPNTIAERQLSLTADSTANKFFIEETYSQILVVESFEIRTFSSSNEVDFDQVLEENKETIMTSDELAIYEKAKVLYDTWGINERGTVQRKKIGVLNVYMKLLKFIENGNITIPEAEIYKYRYLVFHAISANFYKTPIFSSIEDVMKSQGLPLAFKEYYEFNNSGMDLSFYNPFGSSAVDPENLSPLVLNSFLFALMHGQLNLYDIIGMMIKLGKKPLDYQEDFVEFFGKHVMLFKNDTLERFDVLKEVAKGLPAQPAKFDMKSVSVLETLRYMKARGFNDTRAEMVMEALEKDPMVALTLLQGKKMLTAEERQLVDSI